MARTISTIQNQILTNIAADPTLGPALTSQSKRAIFRLFTYIIAVAINILESLIDIFTANMQTVAAAAAPATPTWLQAQIFKFQYDPITPQVIQLNTTTFAPAYPVVDPTKQIISRCSVTTNLSNSVLIKVATGTPPAALSGAQVSALQSYVNQIGIAGVIYNVSSTNSDKIMIAANVYYQGQYSSVISTNVQNAINNYLAAIPFNGTLRLSDLEGAVKAVTGVNDIIFINVQARQDSVALASASYMVQNQLEIARLWNTVSGYIVSETTGGFQLSNTLNFIAE